MLSGIALGFVEALSIYKFLQYWIVQFVVDLADQLIPSCLQRFRPPEINYSNKKAA